jgi:nucleoside-diphosphate-sugar epimerase
LKVLLTGASGFVGSHVLDTLLARGLSVAVLLRTSSDRTFLSHSLSKVEVRSGSISDLESLKAALNGVTHVIHCAGATKAARISDFYRTNQDGTRNIVEAVNATPGVERLVHISSLAAAGPGTPSQPIRETDSPHPVSEYGKSKLAGEREVIQHCRRDYVIIRPPAVYGPRDAGFFTLFQAVSRHILPRPSARQALSLIFVRDLAEAIVTAALSPVASGKIYFASGPEIVTGRSMAEEIKKQMGTWTIPLPLPVALFWPVCLARQTITIVTGKPDVLSLQKFAELRAPGWVCDSSAIQRDLGVQCAMGLAAGIKESLEWYRRERWLAQ